MAYLVVCAFSWGHTVAALALVGLVLYFASLTPPPKIDRTGPTDDVIGDLKEDLRHVSGDRGRFRD